MEIVPFRREHLDALDMGRWDRIAFEKEDREMFIEKYEGHAASGIEDGRCLGIAGITVDKRIGFAWVFLSDEIRKRPFFLTKLIKQGIEIAAKDLSLLSMTVAVLKNYEEANRWARVLGFKPVKSNAEYVHLNKNLSGAV
jgi:hypothetical protein